MKKITSFIASVCIACSMISSPCVSFAEGDISSSDMVTKLEAFIEEEKAFIREQGYNARVISSKNGSVLILFELWGTGKAEYNVKALTQKFKDYCEKNQIDASSVDFMFSAEALETITEPETIKQALTEFIKEQGYNASASVEGQSVIVTFGQQAADEEEYDARAIDQKFRDYCIENQLDDSLVEVRFLADTAETLAEIMGDATGDGEVNILDVISLNKAVMGKEALTEAQLQLIDFNQNGKPDADEALTLLKYIVGLISEL